MNCKILALILSVVTLSAFAQGTSPRSFTITKKSPRALPADLRTETILFLKFDSFDIPKKRPKGFDRREFKIESNHNAMVPRLNRTLYKAAAKYPFKYKIVSFSDKDFAAHGARYLFWMNTFDVFTENVRYSTSGHFVRSSGTGGGLNYVSNGGPDATLGIVDLKTQETYLVNRTVGASRTLMYDRTIQMLINDIKRQFN